MDNAISRRSLVKGMTAAGLGAVLAASTPMAATAAPPRPRTAGGLATGTEPVQLVHATVPADANFPTIGGNLGNQNYTALDGIHRGNVRRLGGAWLNHIEGGLKSGSSQSGLVVVDGVIFIESALGNVHAVDGRTGETLWTYTQTRGTLTRRGVAVGQGLVFTHGKGSWVIALDQKTGEVVWERQITGYGSMEKVAVTYHDGKLLLGTHNSGRAAGLCVDASNGDVIWAFWGAPGPGDAQFGTWAGDSWMDGGATPWLHPAVDPDLGMVYWTFGNARGNPSSQDGSGREGMNLFANSIVATDLRTGAYIWHFQSVHHDIWDMDNSMNPVLADVEIDGEERQLVIYGSKTGMYYILDRTDGSAPLGIDELPVPQEPRQKTWPTQPYPRQGAWTETRPVEQPLGTEVPGHPARAVPNYVVASLYTPHWDVPILSIPGHGGGADWSAQSFSHSTGMIYTGYGYVAAAHSLTESSNGLRPPGEYQTGGVVAVDVSTNEVAWKQRLPYSLAHGNGILTTAADLAFIGMPDGNLLCLDARSGREIWRFQTGAAISASPVMYEVDGEQYLAVYAGGTSIPYGNSAPRGDNLWAFKIGGSVPALPAPPPPVVRRPVSGGPVEGADVNNTVTLARTYNANTGIIGSEESTAVAGMAPTHLRVPVGTTVTFVNPADNVHVHSATQFFEGLFNPQLAPGESFEYTFTDRGEFFYNDSHSGRPTGKVEVY
ncbi:PQQ-binding-like beta-propeller repeat protein [Georgenia sp. MJ173]|uniref:outer membrane protein assembly factor BamB family protein n=1 Tax=Georgenia sunbinii TaxID=3117728 RepID=UPI002F2640A2